MRVEDHRNATTMANVGPSDGEPTCLLLTTSSDDGDVQYVTIPLADILEANPGVSRDGLEQMLASLRPSNEIQFVTESVGEEFAVVGSSLLQNESTEEVTQLEAPNCDVNAETVMHDSETRLVASRGAERKVCDCNHG